MMTSLLSQDAAVDQHSVVHGGTTHDLGSGQSDRGASVIWVAIVHRRQLGFDRTHEAHWTRFLVDIESVAFQSRHPHPTAGKPDRVDLGMRGGVQRLPDTVVLGGNNLTQGIDDDRSERGIAGLRSEFRLGHG